MLFRSCLTSLPISQPPCPLEKFRSCNTSSNAFVRSSFLQHPNHFHASAESISKVLYRVSRCQTPVHGFSDLGGMVHPISRRCTSLRNVPNTMAQRCSVAGRAVDNSKHVKSRHIGNLFSSSPLDRFDMQLLLKVAPHVTTYVASYGQCRRTSC